MTSQLLVPLIVGALTAKGLGEKVSVLDMGQTRQVHPKPYHTSPPIMKSEMIYVKEKVP